MSLAEAREKAGQVLHEKCGEMITYAPTGGSGTEISAIPKEPESIDSSSLPATLLLKVRLSTLVSPSPIKGDRVTFRGQDYLVVGIHPEVVGFGQVWLALNKT